MNRTIKSALLIAVAFAASVAGARAQVASNPPLTLEQSATAGGGGKSSDAGGAFTVEGTIGQAVTNTSRAASLTVKSGFFTAAVVAPTAATVSIGGRIRTTSGRGIRNVRVTLTDQNGNQRTAISGIFGVFRFSNVIVGETYTLTAVGRRYNFVEPTIVVLITEGSSSINFTAVPR